MAIESPMKRVTIKRETQCAIDLLQERRTLLISATVNDWIGLRAVHD